MTTINVLKREIESQVQSFEECHDDFVQSANECQKNISACIKKQLIDNPDMKGHRRSGTVLARTLYNILYGMTFVAGIPLFVKCATGNYGFFSLKTKSRESAEDVYKAAREIKVNHKQ